MEHQLAADTSIKETHRDDVWSGLVLTGAMALVALSGCADTAPPPAGPALSPPAAASRLTTETIPAQLKLSEKVFAFGTDLVAYSGKSETGTFTQTNWVGGTSFDYHDSSGAKVASAKQSLFSWGVEITIFDGQGGKLGTVKEEVFKNLLSWKSHYSVLDAQGNVVAHSEKIDFFSTSVDIHDMSGNPVATMSRPALNLAGDTWTVSFSESTVDRRLLMFIPCYKTYADNHKD